MRELILSAGASADGSSPPLSQSLLDGFSSYVVASLYTHYFVQQRSIDREERGSLLCTRCVVPIQPVHHEPELQARRERRWNLRMNCVNPNVARCNLCQDFFQALHVE